MPVPSGILLVDKPQGWTSHDVVAKLRGILKERRIGHGGTLDPMATGLLPIFIGRATRAAEYASLSGKQYIARLRLGIRTDTQDITGSVLDSFPVIAGEKELRDLLLHFTGKIFQVPPMYSAVKIGGQPMYKLARKGKSVERPPRPVTVSRLELLGGGGGEYELLVDCSAGTYVRTLCSDIGDALGCGAALSALRRTRAAGFSLEDAHSLETVAAAAAEGRAAELILPVDSLFPGYPAVTLDETQERFCRDGREFPISGAEGRYRVYGPGGDFLMLGELRRGPGGGSVMRTEKSFFEVNGV
ncbi:tRNA pseudouridine55 synthase [Papillibacter cinnamivorans DSM 12816]|uniref:tRNA pseudouridine synthase B n=2 Tax=Papillibacter TaxID=100175 RepID=A0A1W2BJV0_9FIRM|nr:tRNA pseudouridine55 synthase [Papillibacter cinnamivorans DSM 12816]